MEATSKGQEDQSNDLTSESKSSQKWWTMLGIGTGQLMYGLDVYIVNTALPVMVKALDTSFATIQWVILSYPSSVTLRSNQVTKKPDYPSGCRRLKLIHGMN